MTDTTSQPEQIAPNLAVAPSPHASSASLKTRRMMLDVLIALVPVLAVSIVVFRQYAVMQLLVCIASCIVAEGLFMALRGKRLTLTDGSAVVTGAIIALSLPWSAPPYVGAIAAVVAIGIGKVVFGGLGQNLFNPAMVGRAFVMICFAGAMGASAYVDDRQATGVDVLTQATPMTTRKAEAAKPSTATPDAHAGLLMQLVKGTVNGSLGETSAIACLLGMLYLCWRRTASWQISAGVLVSAGVIGGLINLAHPEASFTVLHELAGGALLFGAVYIATDPVTSPLTRLGKWIFGAGIGALVMVIRYLSGYPEGVMFAVLLMNAMVPLINRWTIPTPVGGPVPVKK